jgi:uncharacterized protein (DUF488 family)
MRKRQKALLYLIKVLKATEREITKTLLDKLLFLLKKEYGADSYVKFYSFYPYKYGPFSSMFYYDLSDLKSRGLIDDGYNLSQEATTSAEEIQERFKDEISNIAVRFDKKNVVGYVYEKYPEYSVKSELQSDRRKKHSGGAYTIGYEGRDIDAFLDLLIQNYIDIVVDVRANPFSMNFSFIGERLKSTLDKVGIEYMNIPELGIPGESRKELVTNEDYKKLFRMYKNKVLSNQENQVEELAELTRKYRIVLVCFEKDAHHCHRGVLASEIEKKMHDKVVHL